MTQTGRISDSPLLFSMVGLTERISLCATEQEMKDVIAEK